MPNLDFAGRRVKKAQRCGGVARRDQPRRERESPKIGPASARDEPADVGMPRPPHVLPRAHGCGGTRNGSACRSCRRRRRRDAHMRSGDGRGLERHPRAADARRDRQRAVPPRGGLVRDPHHDGAAAVQLFQFDRHFQPALLFARSGGQRGARRNLPRCRRRSQHPSCPLRGTVSATISALKTAATAKGLRSKTQAACGLSIGRVRL